MPSIIIKHTVQDFPKWKTAFDEHAETRKAGGCLGGKLFQDAKDPNHLTIVMHWDSLQKAQGFLESSNLREVMEKAGVTSQPEIQFLNDAGQFSF
ncbi:MAG: antibiotic biosynthesis monooxygenase [Bacteroidota bacterium]